MAEISELRETPQKTVEWKIKNFLDLPQEIDYFLKSHIFSVSKARWHLQIYPNGQRNMLSSGYVGCYLRKETSPEEQSFAFSVQIRSIDGSGIDFDDHFTFEKRMTVWGRSKFCERSEIMDFLASDGSLTIFCSVQVLDKLLVSPTTETASQTQSSVTEATEVASHAHSSVTATAEVASQSLWFDGLSLLGENFKNLYLSQQFADVRITVGDRKFLGHRSVLAARSTVFSAMLSTDMVEKNNGLIEITDCDSHSFEDFLLFLYTGDFDIVSISNAASLYEASEKYDLMDLKAECVRCMITQLNVDSFCDVLRIASLHNESHILVAATNFFLENVKDILVNSKWQNFMEEDPLLGSELFLKIY